MATNETAVQLQATSRGFFDLQGHVKSFTQELHKTVKELVSFRGIASTALAMFSIHQWSEGFHAMGRLQELTLDASRAMGKLGESAEVGKALTEMAGQLGIEYEKAGAALKSFNKYHASIGLTTKEMLELTKEAGAFGEAIGAGAEQGAEMMGRFKGVAKLSNKEIKGVQQEMLALQNTIGASGDELAQFSEKLTPVLTQLKTLGATSAQIKDFTQGVGKLAVGFAAMGKNIGEAADFADKLLDPSNLHEYAGLFAKLGISINRVTDAMEGIGVGDFMEQVTSNLPKLGEQIKKMGAIAGDTMAKQLGLSGYRQAIEFSKMNSAEAQKAFKAQEDKRKEEELFNKQLKQTLQTWQRYFVGLTQTFEALKMEFSSVLGGENFQKYQQAIVKIAKTVIQMLRDIHIDHIIAQSLKLINSAVDNFGKVIRAFSKAFGKGIQDANLGDVTSKLTKLMDAMGDWGANFVEATLPKMIKGFLMIFNKVKSIFEFIDKHFGKKGTLMAIAGLVAGKNVAKGAITGTGLGGAIFGPLLHHLTGGLLGGKVGMTKTNPMWVRDASLPGGETLGDSIKNKFMDLFKGNKGMTPGLPGKPGTSFLPPGFESTAGIPPGAPKGVPGAGMGGMVGGLIALKAAESAVKGLMDAMDDENVTKIMDKKKGEIITGSERFGVGMSSYISSMFMGMLPESTSKGIAQHISKDGVAKTLLKLTGPAGAIGVAINDGFKDAFDEENVKKMFELKEGEKAGLGQKLGAGVSGMLKSLSFGAISDQTAGKVGKGVAGALDPTKVANGMADALMAAKDKITGWTDAFDKWDREFEAKVRAGIKSVGSWMIEMQVGANQAIDEAIQAIQDKWELLSKQIGDFVEQKIFAPVATWFKKWGQEMLEEPAKAWESIKEVFSTGWNNLLDILSTNWLDVFEGIAKKVWDGFKNLTDNLGKSFTNWIVGAQKSWGAGMDRIIFWIAKGLKEIPGFGKAIDLDKIAGSMVDTLKMNVTELNKQYNEALVKAQTTNSQADYDMANQIADQINETVAKNNKFAMENTDTPKLITLLSSQYIDHKKALDTIANNTGPGGAQAQKLDEIAHNTRKPPKFIDLNALAIRSNESRSVFLSYSSTPMGQ